MNLRTRRGVARVALLAFMATLATAFIHTDDGCAVEQHCRTCRVALASAGAVPTAATPVPLIQPGEAVVPSDAPVSPAQALSSDSSRGPPIVS